VALFEVGRVFSVAQASSPVKTQTGGLCHKEERRVAIALTGSAHAALLERQRTRREI